MTVFIGLLRAVNVGVTGQVGMASLRDLLHAKGYSDVRTVLQSGNVVFKAASMNPAQLEQTLERDLEEGLGLRTKVFVRTRAQWHEVLQRNPFPREAVEDPAHLLFTALKTRPTPAQWTLLRQSIRGRERVGPGDRHAYVVYPDGIGTSKLSLTVIERALSTYGTGRNWNTVRRLDQLAAS